MTSLRTPLNQADLNRLDELLSYSVGPRAPSVDKLDGLLHALAVGPLTLPPDRWTHMIWGGVRGLPSNLDDDVLLELTDLVFRRMNQVVGSFAGKDYSVSPIFKTQLTQGRNLSDPTGFAIGFMNGVNLTRGVWADCLDEIRMRLIRGLGDTASPIEVEGIETLQDKDDACHAIVSDVIGIYEFWMPKRIAAKEAAMNPLGRNDPCSCGSGKKYKKCCMV